MKFTLAFTSLLLAISQSSALSVSIRDTPDGLEARAGPAAACGDPRNTLPFLRAWNAALVDHFYTTNAAEMQNAVTNLGYVAEGTTGYIFSNQQPATVPFYRLYNPTINDHFYTTSASERDNAIQKLGYNSEGTAGFVYPTNTTCSGLPLYRSYNGPGTDHFYTMSAAERDSAAAGGWAYEGIAGYMFPY